MMEWHLHLADYITDRHRVQNLLTLVEPPLRRAKGSIPDLIYEAVFGYLDAIEKPIPRAFLYRKETAVRLIVRIFLLIH